MTDIDESLRIVGQFQKPLRLHESDVKYIVNRFSYLKQKMGSTGLKGFPDIRLLLTSIYCYIRDPNNGRKIVSPYKFIWMCDNFEFSFTVRDLWRYEQLYFEHNLYPRAPVSNVFVYFEAAWYDISKDLSLDEQAKGELLFLFKKIQTLKGPRRAPWIVTATTIYLLDKKRGRYRTQEELTEYFGISEVSLRNAAQAYEACMSDLQFLEE